MTDDAGPDAGNPGRDAERVRRAGREIPRREAVGAPVDDRHDGAVAAVAEANEGPAGKRPVGDADRHEGQLLAARRVTAEETRAVIGRDRRARLGVGGEGRGARAATAARARQGQTSICRSVLVISLRLRG